MTRAPREALWIDVAFLGLFAAGLGVSLAVAAPHVDAPSYGPYQVHVVRVIDGDTVEATLPIWPDLYQHVSIRLADVDAPELRAAASCERQAAADAKAFVERQLAGAGSIILDQVRHDKYAGRVIGQLIVDGESLSHRILVAGHARTYAGEKRTPWCEDPKP